MSYVDFISFPQKFKVLPLPDDKNSEHEAGVYHYITEINTEVYSYLQKNINIDSNSSMSFHEKYSSGFDKYSSNPYIYMLSVGTPSGYHDRLVDISTSDMEDETREKELDKLHDEYSEWMRQIMHDSFHSILEKNEFVEIYTVWHDGTETNDYGPPLSEKTITLDDVQTYPELLTTNDRCKLTIIKTV